MSPFVVLLLTIVYLIGNVSNAQNLPKEEYIIKFGDELTHVIGIEEGEILADCQVTDPNRKVHNLYPVGTDDDSIHLLNEPSPASPCGFRVSPIDKNHESNWVLRAIYTKDEKNNTKSQTVNVILRGDDMMRDAVVLNTPRGGSIKYDLDSFEFGNMIFCNIKLPNGTVYEIYPKSNISDPNIVITTYEKCAFTLQIVTVDYTGSWEMDTDVKVLFGNQTYVHQPLDILIEEKIDATPSNVIDIYQNYNLEISLSENVKNLKQCEITSPDTTKVVYTSNSPNCFYLIKDFTSQMNGTWTIRGVGDVILYSNIDVFVMEQPIIDTDVTIVLGIPTVINLGPENSVYCEATDANGILRGRQTGQCRIDITRVQFSDDGKWIVNVGLPGAMSLIKYEYKIHVEDLGEQNPGRIITSTKIANDESYAQIVCRVLVDSMDSCHMIRADGEVFILTEGIGQGRYKHFVNNATKTENEIDFVQCGVHIDKPTDLDFLPWQCNIIHSGIEIGANLILKANPVQDPGQITELTNITLTTTDVNVTVDEQFDMICEYPLSIRYCWFRAPNRTTISITEDTNNTEYEYLGRGFDRGVCGIRIKSASRSDNGMWKCNVGTTLVEDKSANIHVKVFVSRIEAERKQLIWHKGVSLACQTYDNSSLEYCRFVKPDGNGINPMGINSLEYDGNGTNLDVGRCQLNLNGYASSHIGIWFCHAKPLKTNVEHFDRIVMYNQYWENYPTSTGVLAWTLYVLTMAIVIVIISIAIFKYHSKLPMRSPRRGVTRRTTSTRSNTSLPINHRTNPPPYTPELYQIDEVKTPVT